MLSTLGLPSPRKNWLLRSVLTTSLSTTNCTLRQNARCSSGVMESLAQSGASAGGQPAARALPSPHPTRKGTGCCRSDLGGGRPEVPLAQPRDQPGPGRPQLALGPWGPRATSAPGSVWRKGSQSWTAAAERRPLPPVRGPRRVSPVPARARAPTFSAGSPRIPSASARAAPRAPPTWTRGCSSAAGRARPPPGLTHQCRRRKWPGGGGRSWGGANTGRSKRPQVPGDGRRGSAAPPDN